MTMGGFLPPTTSDKTPIISCSARFFEANFSCAVTGDRVASIPPLAFRRRSFRRPRMRQVNQTSERNFLPNLLSSQVIGIETEQISDLRFLQRPSKILFRSPPLRSNNR